MAEKKPAENDAPEEPDFEAGLTSEQIMNMNFETTEDPETAGMTIDQIIERASGGMRDGDQGEGTYRVGDIMMTKEDYEAQFGQQPKEGEKQKPGVKGEKKAD